MQVEILKMLDAHVWALAAGYAAASVAAARRQPVRNQPATARREPARLTAPPGCGQEHLRSSDGRLVLAAAGEHDHVAAFIDLEPGASTG
jgi:hypothetical protein